MAVAGVHKKNTVRKETLNSQPLLKTVCFNPTDIAETLNPGIVSLTEYVKVENSLVL